ncbi:pyrroline-5-carboxylate reductase [Nocardioides sp. CER19]|uniref:pyrroline-5-carboxylate reductase n=1 Tax=Nocardioides sp. CER19 TaxID=3038538 RepID=UPI00244CC9DD|nr:pyrroline-5-carboxylate reductase [Nocardioides sp. CER19]MDH2414241.1 pyrroline-5-carboxylate reductase [Nocardioides sp. CER19]
MSRSRIAIVGVGNMGEAVLSGLVKSGHAPEDLAAGVRRTERGEELTARYGVRAGSAAEVAAAAEIVVLGIKPYDVVTMLRSLDLKPGQLVVSLAAGITTAAMEAAVPDGVAVVRVMPNTPSLVGEGMSVVAGGATAAEDDVADAVALMKAVGDVAVVPEKQVDAAAAISGSGPAYVFYVAEALVEAGVHLGLPRATAAQLVTQTLAGSSLLLRETGEHPAVLREQVTSPGGTTAAALHALESAAVRAAFLDATRANRDRSREISAEG